MPGRSPILKRHFIHGPFQKQEAYPPQRIGFEVKVLVKSDYQ